MSTENSTGMRVENSRPENGRRPKGCLLTFHYQMPPEHPTAVTASLPLRIYPAPSVANYQRRNEEGSDPQARSPPGPAVEGYEITFSRPSSRSTPGPSPINWSSMDSSWRLFPKTLVFNGSFFPGDEEEAKQFRKFLVVQERRSGNREREAPACRLDEVSRYFFFFLIDIARREWLEVILLLASFYPLRFLPIIRLLVCKSFSLIQFTSYFILDFFFLCFFG